MSRSRCDCSIIIPTRTRSATLSATLARLEALPDERFEVIVVDNGSTDDTSELAARFPRIRWIGLSDNLGAAARNVGAAAAEGRVLLMLDDDSWPEPGVIEGVVELFDRRKQLGAAGLRIRLADPPHAHDAGGVAGVFFNCGGAVRRSAFLEAGGFPTNYGYYAEEYDLCCRLWLRGWTVEPRGEYVVWHRRTTINRDNDNMLRLLVRNNLRLWNRYAPEAMRGDLVESTLERYRRVAEKENALRGFENGVAEARGASNRRPTPLSTRQFERLLGLDRARLALSRWADNQRVRCVAVWSRGKSCESLMDLLKSLHIHIDAIYDRSCESATWRGISLRNEARLDPNDVDAIVPGTLSCGVADDLRIELQRRFPTVPVASPAPWAMDELAPPLAQFA